MELEIRQHMNSKNELPDEAQQVIVMTLSDIDDEGVNDISDVLRQLLADVFALYLKTKNFHWHMSGPHFRDYHLLLDEQSEQILKMTDDIAERSRKIGGTTLRSIGDIGRHQRLKDNNQSCVAPLDMLAELGTDNAADDLFASGALSL